MLCIIYEIIIMQMRISSEIKVKRESEGRNYTETAKDPEASDYVRSRRGV